MLKRNIPFIRDRYISLAYGNSQAEVSTEDISALIWDFRPEEYQIPLEEEDSPTLRDYVTLGILKIEQVENPD